MTTILSRSTVYRFLEPDFGPVLHAKRLLSLSLATVGVYHAPRASIAEIGRSLAAVTGKSPKHCIKQIDRLLSNDGVDLAEEMAVYMRVIVGDREAVSLAMDCTEYPVTDQATVVLSLVTQGRKYAVRVAVLAAFAIPLLNLFHELAQNVPLHDFIGGPV